MQLLELKALPTACFYAWTSNLSCWLGYWLWMDSDSVLSFAWRARSLYYIHCAPAFWVSVQVYCNNISDFHLKWSLTWQRLQAPCDMQLSGHVHFGCWLSPLLSLFVLSSTCLSQEKVHLPVLWYEPQKFGLVCQIRKVIASLHLFTVTIVSTPFLSSNLWYASVPRIHMSQKYASDWLLWFKICLSALSFALCALAPSTPLHLVKVLAKLLDDSAVFAPLSSFFLQLRKGPLWSFAELLWRCSTTTPVVSQDTFTDGGNVVNMTDGRLVGLHSESDWLMLRLILRKK